MADAFPSYSWYSQHGAILAGLFLRVALELHCASDIVPAAAYFACRDRLRVALPNGSGAEFKML